ncbi:CRISPR-associated Cse4 family protein [Stackebrandtia endophytica]|uniref:CRISPR-associated Cse4 family protein n=1 Tax=Stackebrandtia endophytica TaxID=1496996 RepID=A0A543AS35_9ACTN|nr:type I-E CRISPR-associated protein Cas7/Cse4/CasC [Stackebrandtia endophytica]TQL75392.1 CRISPR-associated Cse4 family protein [Stackebrandtia endophytica]
MNQPLYIDIHALQTLPFSNPNRDSEGAPKTMIFGGRERTRISSQSWKRQIRIDIESKLGDPAIRTRRVVRGVAERLQDRHGWSTDDAEAAGRQVARSAGIKLEKAKDEKEQEVLTTSVLLYLPAAGLDELTAIAANHKDAIVAAEAKKTPKGVLPVDAVTDVLKRRSASINLFGRMLAELPGANVDGAVQMAHAFTTHETTPEFDFFAAVDDVEADLGIPGSGHINTAMFSAGTFYRYANIDVRGLARNLGADDSVTDEMVTQFLQAFIRTVPTGKNRPTAPATIPDLVHIAVRTDRPVSMAPAFEKPIIGHDGNVTQSIQALERYAGRLSTLLTGRHLAWSGHVSVSDDELQHMGEDMESIDNLVAKAISESHTTEPQ